MEPIEVLSYYRGRNAAWNVWFDIMGQWDDSNWSFRVWYNKLKPWLY